MKSAGLIVISISVILTSFYLMRLHKKNLDFIKKLSDFFSEFASLTSLYELDAVRCIEKISLMPGFSSQEFLTRIVSEFSPGCNVKELWINSVNDCCRLPSYMSEVKELLLNFADVLGKYSREEFCSRCASFSQKAEAVYKTEKQKWEKNRSLHMGAGVFAAAAVFIIFV